MKKILSLWGKMLKIVSSLSTKPMLWLTMVMSFIYTMPVFADDGGGDKLQAVLDSVKDNFGTSSTFIKLLYGLEIIAGAYAYHKTKHPGSIIGIVVLSLFLNFALKTWVFGS